MAISMPRDWGLISQGINLQLCWPLCHLHPAVCTGVPREGVLGHADLRYICRITAVLASAPITPSPPGMVRNGGSANGGWVWLTAHPELVAGRSSDGTNPLHAFLCVIKDTNVCFGYDAGDLQLEEGGALQVVGVLRGPCMRVWVLWSAISLLDSWCLQPPRFTISSLPQIVQRASCPSPKPIELRTSTMTSRYSGRMTLTLTKGDPVIN